MPTSATPSTSYCPPHQPPPGMPPPRSATRPRSPHSPPLFWPLPLSRLLLHTGTQPMRLYRLLPLPCTSFISFGDTWHASWGEVGWQRVQTKEDLHEGSFC